MTTKRQIQGQQYNVAELVDGAITQVNGMALDLDGARAKLAALGHRTPSDAIVTKYARESAILSILARQTGANFENQIGKIDFSNQQRAIEDVDAYLWRRVHGMRSNYKGRR
jgi:hypothetical protein